MTILYDTILKLKQDVSQITSNETLEAFDLEFCKRLDSESSTDTFIESRVKKTLAELNLCKGIDYCDHYRTAYENYNEAVTYVVLKDKSISIKGIPESKTPTPDFEIVVDCAYPGEDPNNQIVYLEVKTLGFAEGNLIYKKGQLDSLDCQIQIEDQHKRGKRVCSAERCVAPLGNVSFVEEIEKILQKIEQNIKPGQFAYGDGKSTVLFVDLNQLWFPSRIEECLAIFPDLQRSACASGRLWMIAFAKLNERIYLYPEFEGKGCFSEEFQQIGILNAHPEIKGLVFGVGRTPTEKKFFGFFRQKEKDEPTSIAMYNMCDFCNSDQNSSAWKFYEDYKHELGIK